MIRIIKRPISFLSRYGDKRKWNNIYIYNALDMDGGPYITIGKTIKINNENFTLTKINKLEYDRKNNYLQILFNIEKKLI